MQLGLDHIPKPDDAADALAIAICHSVTAPALERYRVERMNILRTACTVLRQRRYLVVGPWSADVISRSGRISCR